MLLPWLLVLAGAAALAVGLRSDTASPWLPSPAPSPSPVKPPRKASPMNEKLLAAALADLPDASAVVAPGSPSTADRFDAAAGGRRPDYLGAPAWAYYSTFASLAPDGSKRWGGSTCSTFLAYWMGKANTNGGTSATAWPAGMIDRSPTDAYGAPGSGFAPGASMSKLVGDAKKRGLYVAADSPGFALQPADIYHQDHPPAVNSDHVGLVRSVGEPKADGTRDVGTIDGGAATAVSVPGASAEANAALSRGASARWQARILSADGRTLSLGGVPARLLGVIRGAPEALA